MPWASASAMTLRIGVMPPQMVASTRTALQASSLIACSIICRSSQVLPAAMIGTVELRRSSR